ncbi:MAG: hypothetical protein MRZ79_14580 [Bacteroidia bacterium]|nr:hypothetical protein [Bacteroidia bacterium]
MILIVILWVLYYAIHSLLASTQLKSQIEVRFPSWIPFYRLFYNLVAAMGFLGIWIAQKSVIEQQLFYLGNWAYFGLFMMGVGSILGLIALRGYNLGEFSGLSYVNGGEQAIQGSLRTDGMNSFVRHPLYFAGLWVLWGWLVWRQTNLALAFATISSLYLIVGSWFEEKKLIIAFGEEYLEYQKRVKMLIPFLF